MQPAQTDTDSYQRAVCRTRISVRAWRQRRITIGAICDGRRAGLDCAQLIKALPGLSQDAIKAL
jgi:hypothetical protein